MYDQPMQDEEATPMGFQPPKGAPPKPPAPPDPSQGEQPSQSPRPALDPGPSPQHGSGSRWGRRRAHDRAESLLGDESSTRGSSDRDIPPAPSNMGDLEELGAVLLSGFSKLATFMAWRAGTTKLDWRMSEREARAASRPIVRMLSRRIRVRKDVADALDVGRSADSVVGYVTRVLSGEPAEGATASDQRPPESVIDVAAVRRRFAEAERVAEAQRQRAEDEARDAAARAVAERRSEHSSEMPVDQVDPFAGFEDV